MDPSRALITMIGAVVAANVADEGEAVDAAEHQVDEHHVERLRGGQIEGDLGIVGLTDHVSLLLEEEAEEVRSP